MPNHIVHYFKETDLRRGHMGLTELAKNAKLKPTELGAGEFLLFVNRSQTHFKLLGSHNLVVHYRSPRGRVDLRAIQYLPKAFSTRGFNFDAALSEVLKKDLAKRGHRTD